MGETYLHETCTEKILTEQKIIIFKAVCLVVAKSMFKCFDDANLEFFHRFNPGFPSSVFWRHFYEFKVTEQYFVDLAYLKDEGERSFNLS
jgi:hypothetical protein